MVKVNSGRNSTVLRHPLQQLYPSEVGCHLEGGTDQMQDEQKAPENVSASQCEDGTAEL